VTANFENPITLGENYPKADKYIHLNTKPEAATAVKKAGISVVSLANNHMKDFGKQGLVDTIKTFNKVDVDTVGAGSDLGNATKISYKTKNGVKIATLGISDVLPKGFGAQKNRSGIALAKPSIFFPLVAKAKKNADLVIVHVHWGLEYDSSYHPRQKDLAHALIDAGADIIVGHHPHVLESVEVYKNGVIFYSLGNFIFDQGWSRTRESVLAQYKIGRDGKARIEIHPMYIREGRPRPVTGWTNVYRREKIFAQITDEMMYTNKWNQVWKREGDKIIREIGHVKLATGGNKHAK
jgi:poly-gamma-glutamate synthesis protein (capsule biosynthesis protein)